MSRGRTLQSAQICASPRLSGTPGKKAEVSGNHVAKASAAQAAVNVSNRRATNIAALATSDQQQVQEWISQHRGAVDR